MEDTISILRGLKERYEVFHGVKKITDSAWLHFATLSHRYITVGPFLRDKAIDLVDEACALIKTELDLCRQSWMSRDVDLMQMGD